MSYKSEISSKIVELQILLENAAKDTGREKKIDNLMVKVFNEFGSLAVVDVEVNKPVENWL